MWILPSSPSIWPDVSGQPTVIILASGRGERFIASGGQGSKLAALIGGKTVLQWTLEAVKATGLPWHLEDAGHPGMGDSIAAAVRSTKASSGWLILPADLPMIAHTTILAVAEAIAQGAQAAYPIHNSERGHPVGFGASADLELQDLKGNRGAAGILSARHATEIIVSDAGCVMDVDTLDQLQKLEKLLQTRSR
jgi:molybdenum cofactor cytidylyltransferase